MKFPVLLSATLILLFSFEANAQKLKEYTTSNGLLIQPGDTVVLGVGSSPDGYFYHIYSVIAETIFASLADETETDFRLPEFFNGAPVVIKKIKDRKGVVSALFDTDGWGAFMIDIEDAIRSCEIAWCRPDGFLSQEEYEKLVLLYRSVLDETITVEKFNALRSEMLGQEQ